jgi:hypothetical protein
VEEQQMSATVLTDYLGRKVRFTTERRRHILKNHPEMMEWVDKIGNVLAHPERVVRSRSDPEAELYYVWQPRTRIGSKYLCVVVIVREHDAFVLTAYLTDSIKKGRVLWPRNSA